MGYSKSLADTYAKNRNRYRSSDKFLTPLLKKVGIKGATVLDFGCGDGSEAERLLAMGAKKIVGVDSSAQMIRLAKAKKLPKSEFSISGAKLKQKAGQFDIVFSRFVLHYIRDLRGQFKELSRVTKKGGYFLALFQCLTDDPKLINTQLPINLGKGKNVTKIKILAKSIDMIVEDLNKAGFKATKVLKVKNSDSSIDPSYKNRLRFKNSTYVLLAEKV